LAGHARVRGTKPEEAMQQEEIEAAFARILEEVAKVDRADVAGDKRLREDLGLDSLSLIDVAVAAEDAFGVRIPDEDLECFQVVGDALHYIRRANLAVKQRPALEAADPFDL
jgi:acyl carrier protein